MLGMLWFGRKPAPDVETRIAALEQRATLAEPNQALLEIFGATGGVAGVPVNASTAMSCTIVRRAVQAIAEPIGSLPLHFYRRTGDDRKRDPEHPVAQLLRDPNAWTAGSTFREQLQRDALLHGNGYAFINRQGDEPRELIRIDPEQVEVLVSAVGEPVYRVKEPTPPDRLIAFGDMLHLRAPSFDGYVGRSIVTECSQAIALALLLERHGVNLFAQGARPGGVIEFPKTLPEGAVARIRAAWRAAFEGASATGRTAILWDGGSFKTMALSSVDAQFIELCKHMVDEIARAFGVPPHLLFEMGRATWGNSAELGQQFVAFTMMKWFRAWQDEIRLKLLRPNERADFYAEFLVDDLLRADIDKRATAYSTLIAARVLNPNEVRGMENRPPYAGGEAFVNPNITPERVAA